jgi:hypothetical protein
MRAWTAAPAAPRAASRRRSARRFPACRKASRPASLASSSTPTCAAACSATRGGPLCARRWRLRPACAATRPGQPCVGWSGSNAARALSRLMAEPDPSPASAAECSSGRRSATSAPARLPDVPEPLAIRAWRLQADPELSESRGCSRQDLPATLRKRGRLGRPATLGELRNNLGACGGRLHGGGLGLVEHPTCRGWMSFQPLRHSRTICQV